MKSKKNICSVCLVLFFILVAGITLLPLILLAVASLSPGSELMRNGLNFNIDFDWHFPSSLHSQLFTQ